MVSTNNILLDTIPEKCMLQNTGDLFLSVLLAAVPPCRCSRETFSGWTDTGRRRKMQNAWSEECGALVTSRDGSQVGKMKKSLVQSPMDISGHQPPWMLVRLVILIQFPTFQISIFFSVPVHIAPTSHPHSVLKGHRCWVRAEVPGFSLFCALRVSAIIFKVPLGQRK